MLNHIINQPELKLLSVDIFDTLLLRTVRTPPEVFEQMHVRAPKLFPDGFSSREWRNLRIQAEQVARQRRQVQSGHREVMLSEIYAALPRRFNQQAALQACELETEQQVCFVNPQLQEVLQQVRARRHCPIILTSDMYLTREQLLVLLRHAGVDVDMLTEVWVSCDHQVSKAEGGLFARILEHYRIAPAAMLHIGDNLLADVGAARRLGIQTIHYDLISGSDIRYNFLELENLKFGSCATAIHSLRLLAADRSCRQPAEARPWHTLGAMILGPLFTFLAEWVLDIACQNGIRNIYPLMREGEFLSRLLQAAARARQAALTIRPLFVSRKALFLPTLHADGFTDEHIDYLLNTHDIRVRDVFSVLELDDHTTPFTAWQDRTMAEARHTRLGASTLSLELKAWLADATVRRQVGARAAGAHARLVRYLRAMEVLSAPALTLDIGCRGTMQHSLERVLRSVPHTGPTIHLIMMGHEQTLGPLLNQVDLRGYVGTCGKNKGLIDQLLIRLLELCMMCPAGTTMGYAEEGDGVVPVLEQIIYPNPHQLQQIQRVQEGVCDFQQVYYATGQSQARIRELKQRPDELLMPLARLCSAPLAEEARRLGQWYYDENFGAQQMWQIIDPGQAAAFRPTELERFLSGPSSRRMEWVPGLLAGADPFYALKRYHIERNLFHQLQRVLYAEKILRECRSEPAIIIAGAGEAGRDVYRYLRIAPTPLTVEAFIDNNPQLHGTSLQGIPVRSFTDAFESRCFVIGSLEYEIEISQQIRREKGPEVRIIGFSGVPLSRTDNFPQFSS